MLLVISLCRKFKRLLLFSLSIGVGITAVMCVSSLADYGIKSAQNSLDSMGLRGYTVSSLNISDSDYLKLSLSEKIESASPIAVTKADVNNAELTLIGADKSVETMYSIEIINGYFFTSLDVLNCVSSCVISSNLAKTLFSNENAINRTIDITVNGFTLEFTICGIYKSDPIINEYAQDMIDERIYTPYTTLARFSGVSINSIAVIPKNDSIAAVNAYSKSIFGDNYTVKNIASDRAKIESMMSTVKLILSIIGCLTLIVSGISLTIIMIINVHSSKNEIGLKKSIGATDFDILKEIIVESVITSLAGYFIGIIIYSTLLILTNLFGFKLNFDYQTALFSLLIVAFSSMLSGIAPGIIAAKTNPAITLKE